MFNAITINKNKVNTFAINIAKDTPLCISPQGGGGQQARGSAGVLHVGDAHGGVVDPAGEAQDIIVTIANWCTNIIDFPGVNYKGICLKFWISPKLF